MPNLSIADSREHRLRCRYTTLGLGRSPAVTLLAFTCRCKFPSALRSKELVVSISTGSSDSGSSRAAKSELDPVNEYPTESIKKNWRCGNRLICIRTSCHFPELSWTKLSPICFSVSLHCSTRDVSPADEIDTPSRRSNLRRREGENSMLSSVRMSVLLIERESRLIAA